MVKGMRSILMLQRFLNNFVKKIYSIPFPHLQFLCIRQESPTFSQEGYILGISLDDYEQGNIIRHENTREKPLQDRIKIYEATKVIPGLVWTVYRQNFENPSGFRHD